MVKSYIRLATTQGESIMQTVIYSMVEKIAYIGLFKSPFVTGFCVHAI
jgi:hypothetical protein